MVFDIYYLEAENVKADFASKDHYNGISWAS